MIEFISYTGSYPNLCSGVLTLKVDGHLCRFGHDYQNWFPGKKDGNYESFWRSGGYCSVSLIDGDCKIESGEWIIDEELLPDELRSMSREIKEIFNANVPYGCCGGCI